MIPCMSRVLVLPPSARNSPLAAALGHAGHEVDVPESTDREALLAALDPVPDALAVDLSRAPATGRDIALWVRARKATRAIPIVLVGGNRVFCDRAQALLPGALAADLSGCAAAIAQARRAPGTRPRSVLAGYSGTPLPRKLGIKAGATLVLLGAPNDFVGMLGTVPDRVKVAVRGRGDVVVLFAGSYRELARRLGAGTRAMADRGRLWIAWPKQASGVATDLSERVVRERGLAAGLVDYKVAAFDAKWAGLCFARRRPK